MKELHDISIKTASAIFKIPTYNFLKHYPEDQRSHQNALIHALYTCTSLGCFDLTQQIMPYKISQIEAGNRKCKYLMLKDKSYKANVEKLIQDIATNFLNRKIR